MKIFETVEQLVSSLPNDVRKIHSLFKNAGFKLYVVGGAVRDALMGDKPKDFDLATDAKPEEIKTILAGMRTNLQGESFGVVVVYTDETPEGMEIATFREDISKGRKPEVKVGATIEDDVKRRDLTINALFFDLDTNEIVDLVGGVHDLHNGIVRTVGNPKERFDEDRLRLLRAVRFAMRYNGKLDKETEQAIIDDPILHQVSPERITDEVIKSMKHAKSTKLYFTELYRLGLLQLMFPDCTLTLDKLSDTKSIKVALALLLYKGNASAPLLKKLVLGLKYSADVAESICYLIDMVDKPTTDIFTFFKRKAKTSLFNEEIIEFASALKDADFMEYAKAFVKYKPVTNGQKMIDEEGFKPGIELGNEQKKRETAHFKSLMD